MKTLSTIKKNNIKLTAYQEKIIKQLDKIKNGTPCTVVYKSDCSSKLKAAVKSTVSKVEKISIIPVTKGIDYSNKKSVIAKREEEIIKWGFYNTREPFYTKLDNSFAKNKKSEQYYLLFGPQPNKNARPISEYVLNGDNTTKYTSEQIREMGILQDSYWNKEGIPFYTLKLDGVIAIM